MGFDRHPAQRLDEMPDQVPGRMHACIELAALFVDADAGHAELYRSVDKMNDPVRFLHYTQYLAFADPAGITRLTTALRVKQRGAQDHGEFVLLGRAVEDFHIGLEVITMEKEAKRHIPCPY
ncbi:hypothetical protein D3C78_1515960 [compost metagenome]